jgi:hypothetical protein
VEVLKEDLIFDLTADEDPYKANITAKYTFRNGSEKSETTQISLSNSR